MLARVLVQDTLSRVSHKSPESLPSTRSPRRCQVVPSRSVKVLICAWLHQPASWVIDLVPHHAPSPGPRTLEPKGTQRTDTGCSDLATSHERLHQQDHRRHGSEKPDADSQAQDGGYE
jgi:hypothetical protein